MNTLSITLIILAFLLGVGISSAIWSARLSSKNEHEIVDLPGSGLIVPVRKKKRRLPLTWQADWLQGFSTEMFGAIVTTIFLGVVVSLVQQNENAETQKEDLILQMGSPDHGFAIEAVRRLEYKGWLADGSLIGSDLTKADLTGADLFGADLTAANLLGADLSGANLIEAKLSGAELILADLFRAELTGADLTGANLSWANLSGANLREANLSGAILSDGFLKPAIFNGETILPNGSNWTSETDLTLFTDPNHPDFWQPE